LPGGLGGSTSSCFPDPLVHRLYGTHGQNVATAMSVLGRGLEVLVNVTALGPYMLNVFLRASFRIMNSSIGLTMFQSGCSEQASQSVSLTSILAISKFTCHVRRQSPSHLLSVCVSFRPLKVLPGV